MPRSLGIILLICQLFFWSACSKRAAPKSELSRGSPSGDSSAFLTEFGEEQNIISPPGSALAGMLGSPDLLKPRNPNDETFLDPTNSIRPFAPVYFEFDQYVLDMHERDKVIEVAEFLHRNSDARLLVEGYCDWKGTPNYNKSLGERRASSIKSYLVELGTDAQRIDTLSIGDERAIPNALDSQSRLDRKAEFVVSRGD